MQCIGDYLCTLSCILAVIPRNLYHKCSITLTYLCPSRCFAVKFYLPPMSWLSVADAVKHWHFATIC